MRTGTEYYEVLQVRLDCDQEVIDMAFKALVRKYHPDVGGNADRMRLINEAYEVLRDPVLRRRYDEQRSGKETRTNQPPSSDPTKPPRAEDFRAALSNLFQTANRPYVDVRAGDLHKRAEAGVRRVGHNMPGCCTVMRSSMRPGDAILEAPPKGKGPSLKVRYRLPR